MNKVILIGNLGQDPVARTFENGTMMVALSLATSKKSKDKSTGAMVDRTEWHKLVVFDKKAEIAYQYLRKGSKIAVEGEIRTRSYEKDAQKHYITEIVVFQLEMLGGTRAQDCDPPAPYSLASPPAQHDEPAAAAQDALPEFYDDDIPF